MSTYQLIGIGFAIIGIATIAVMSIEWGKIRRLDLSQMPLTDKFIWLTRIAVGILFFYSGFVKANDYVGFGYKLEEYFLVFGSSFPATKGFWDFFVPLAEPLAWFISIFEIALAVAIIVGWRMNLTAWLTMLMMVFFTILTGYSAITNSVTDCGCFGDALKLTPWESFSKDIILTTMLIPLFLVRKSIKPVPNAQLATALTGLAFLVSGVYSWYCHEHLPLIDYRPYKLGVNINVCSNTFTEEGTPQCNYAPPYFPHSDEYFELLEGNTLLIIFQDIAKAPADAMKQTATLAASLKGKGVQLVGLTASNSDDLARLTAEYDLNYPIALMDKTELKTIVRSHPGYVLLKDGLILDKWHYNDAPDATMILGLL